MQWRGIPLPRQGTRVCPTPQSKRAREPHYRALAPRAWSPPGEKPQRLPAEPPRPLKERKPRAAVKALHSQRQTTKQKDRETSTEKSWQATWPQQTINHQILLFFMGRDTQKRFTSVFSWIPQGVKNFGGFYFLVNSLLFSHSYLGCYFLGYPLSSLLS